MSEQHKICISHNVDGLLTVCAYTQGAYKNMCTWMADRLHMDDDKTMYMYMHDEIIGCITDVDEVRLDSNTTICAQGKH